MVKVTSWTLDQCLGASSMFLVVESSETWLFRHSSNHLFHSPEFRKYIGYEGHPFLENVKNLMQIKEMPKKNGEKVFCFWDNSVWIDCVNLSLLRGEYLSSAVNVLRNSLNILNSGNIDLFQLNYVDSD